jgi:hypothetical protein
MGGNFFSRPNLGKGQFRQEQSSELLLDGTTNFVGTLKSKNVEIDCSITNIPDADLGKYFLGYNPTTEKIVLKEGSASIEFDGLIPKEPVKVATTALVSLNGVSNLIDDVSINADDRVLVKNQTNEAQNGIYLAKAGAWVRASDFDENNEVKFGTLVSVLNGATQANQVWMVTTATTPITIGTTPITFSLFLKLINVSAGDGIIIEETVNDDGQKVKTVSVNAEDSPVDDDDQINVKLSTVGGGTDKRLVIDKNDLPPGGDVVAFFDVTNNVTLSGDTNMIVLVDSSILAITVTLPSTPPLGKVFKIKDKGNALANNITINGNGKLIDGFPEAIINTNYGCIEIAYNGTEWFVLSFVN